MLEEQLNSLMVYEKNKEVTHIKFVNVGFKWIGY